jgi:hypothetical protein
LSLTLACNRIGPSLAGKYGMVFPRAEALVR